MMCVFWLLHRQPHPLSAPLLRPSCSLGHRSIEIRAMNSPTTASTWSSARKSHQRSKLHSRLIAQNCSRHPAFSNPHSDQPTASTSRWKDTNSVKAQMTVGIFSNKLFLCWSVCIIFWTQCFRTLNRLHSCVNITFTRTGKPDSACDLPHCDRGFNATSGTKPSLSPGCACVR